MLNTKAGKDATRERAVEGGDVDKGKGKGKVATPTPTPLMMLMNADSKRN